MSSEISNSRIGNNGFTVNHDWLHLPPRFELGEVSDVAVDSRDRVYLFNRGPHPVAIVDRNGNLLDHWGAGVFNRPHGINIGPDDRVYCTDDMGSTVRVFTPEGKQVLILGEHNRSSEPLSGQPFSGCTNTTIGPGGSIYVSDGYHNARIHKFDPDGRFLLSWGEPGSDEGQFILPHDLGCDSEGRVYVADHANCRIQIFDRNGRYEGQWSCYGPMGLYVSRTSDLVVVTEDCHSPSKYPKNWRYAGSRVLLTNHAGARIAGIGGARPGHQGEEFMAPHGVDMNSLGEIFVADLASSTWSWFFPDQPKPEGLSTVHRLSPSKAVLG